MKNRTINRNCNKIQKYEDIAGFAEYRSGTDFKSIRANRNKMVKFDDEIKLLAEKMSFMKKNTNYYTTENDFTLFREF